MFAAVSTANDLQSLTRLINPPSAQLCGGNIIRNENEMNALIDFLFHFHCISFHFHLDLQWFSLFALQNCYDKSCYANERPCVPGYSSMQMRFTTPEKIYINLSYFVNNTSFCISSLYGSYSKFSI